MPNILQEEQITKIASKNGIEVFHIKTDKFKTNTINVFFYDNLSSERASLNAMMPAVLRRGCQSFPSFKEIALYLEELYGSSFDCGVTKKGERQIIQFYIDFVSDKYTGEASSLFEKAFDLLYEIMTKPLLENGAFKNEYIEQEKENLKKLIESRVNDKVQYAVDRCFEEMCKNEPYGVHEYGSISDVAAIDAQGLFKHYQEVLETLPAYVFVTGNIEEDKIQKMLNKLFQIKRSSIKDVDPGKVEKVVDELKNITEKMNVNQGKLSLGFRTNTPPGHKDYYSLLVYNSILGGGMHSKLFQNVREKESLAYYVFSRMEKFKGLMIVSSGVEIENREKAMSIIEEQMEEIRNGNISDYEYDSAIKSIETGIKSLKDSQLQIVDFYLSQALTGTNDTFDTIIEKVKKVSRQDVVNVSKKIHKDTIYFLTAEEA